MAMIKLLLANGREWSIDPYISPRSGAMRWGYTETDGTYRRKVAHSRGGFASLAEAHVYARQRGANI